MNTSFRSRLVVGAVAAACAAGCTSAPPSSEPTGSVASALATTGVPCSSAGQCASGHCVDGVCCNSACGGGTRDLQACSNVYGAVPGLVDGTCTTLNRGDPCGSLVATNPCIRRSTTVNAGGRCLGVIGALAACFPCDGPADCSGAFPCSAAGPASRASATSLGRSAVVSVGRGPHCVYFGSDAGTCGRCRSNLDCLGRSGRPVCNPTTGACSLPAAPTPSAPPGTGARRAHRQDARRTAAAGRPSIDGVCTTGNGARACLSGVCDARRPLRAPGRRR